MSEEHLYFNGVNGATGRYGLAPRTAEELSNHILGIEEQAPDNLTELKEKLKQDTINRIFNINATLLSDSNAENLEQDAASRLVWLEALLKALASLPINSINSSINRTINATALRTLIGELNSLSQSTGDITALIADLQALAQTKDSSWDNILNTLYQGLDALAGLEQSALANGSVPWNDLIQALHDWLSAMATEISHLGVIEGVDPTDLAQAGWGVIFAAQDPRISQLKQALAPLLSLRRSQAGQYFKVYEGGNGFRSPKDTPRTFLGRHNARPEDPADPEKVPYYLLIVGGPEEIPFRFQYQLDVQYAVGRIDFGDDLAAYANYARSVAAAEAGDVALAPKATFFGVSNPDDQATQLSANHLIQPLYESLKETYAEWEIDAVLGNAAKKGRLLRLMGGEETPAFLFTASHGMEFDADDPKGRQMRHQGALLCGDWPGPHAWRGEIPQDHYLAGEDLTDEANLLGMIAFFFACYGAGTPLYDEFSKQAFKERRETIAERPFIAALPKAMLSLSKGGALAVVGHVERAWGASFLGPRQSEQIAVFESAIARLFQGHPIGSAMEYFNVRYAALSTELNATLEDIEWGGRADPYELAGMWTANNDARGYIVIGDPAVRLPVARSEETASGRGEIVSASAQDFVLDVGDAFEKPDDPEITEGDWQNTPFSVKRYIQRLRAYPKNP
jgi:hypothetical protein